MVDDIVDEALGRDGHDAQFLVVFANIVADAVEQVSFAEADSAMDEEGIVRLARSCGNADGCGFDELIRWAFDEVVESVQMVEF